ncbi:putative pentatricopeptide repeat-containing protein [Senna tora]|uniref:Putative pentatricopeptide repeat-containing protein n=1 Tax=Senna tora TaxID=362788 RepID=A0A834T469_9FABA|nr:putative pentatricopeptide repeat-containing protein [Senna tora]
MSFDGETLERHVIIRSKEAVVVIENLTEALFGRPEIAPDGRLGLYFYTVYLSSFELHTEMKPWMYDSRYCNLQLSYIDGLCKSGRISYVQDLIYEMHDDRGQLRDVITYSVLLDALRKRQHLDEASKLFKQIIDRGIQPNVCTYTLLIDGLCKGGRLNNAKNGCLPDLVTFLPVGKT